MERQVQLLDLSRASVDFRPRALPEGDLKVMRQMARSMERASPGAAAPGRTLDGREHVDTLIRRMRIEALHRCGAD